jgi:N6-adenosine-specific RNA methylase IME4
MTEACPFGDLPSAHYRVILVDPPWAFRHFSRKGHGKHPDRHYGVMDLPTIRALPVRRLAHADGCALFMWTTMPFLPAALEVMAAWGFRYSTAGAWAKRSKHNTGWAFGTGYLYRGAVEPWLVGTLGKPKRVSRAVRNLIVAPTREHSRKPDQMRADIEALFPGPYLELFAREAAPGWDAWGDQCDRFAAPSLGLPQPESAEVSAHGG